MRGFLIQSLTGISNKNCRDTKSLSDDKCGGTWVPCRVTPCLKGISKTTVRETGSIRLLLNQRAALKIFKHSNTALHWICKRLMLLRRGICKWLKPMGIMSCTHLDRPVFHSGGNLVGNLPLNFFTIIHGVHNGFVSLCR